MTQVIDTQHLDAEQEEQALAAENNCSACGAPQEPGLKFCNCCGSPLTTPGDSGPISGESGSSRSALPDHTFQCQNCGSEVATSLDKRSYVCPFCDSTYVIELPPDKTGRQRPEFIIGFAITAEQAQQKYFSWIKQNSWFRPGDLATRAISDKQKGVYLPFWHFSMQAASQWSAQIGEYWYRTETYTTRNSKGKSVTRTRRVRETEWFPLRGEYQRYYHGFLVPATQGIKFEESQAIQPFRLEQLARYRPFYLAGWMAEEYSIPMDEATKLTEQEFRRRQEQAVQRFLPGDTHRNLSVQTQLETNGSDLILLPIHVLSYRYKDRLYRFLVNGQTGKVVGEKPWSTSRIGLAVAAGVAIILLIVFLIWYLSEQR